MVGFCWHFKGVRGDLITHNQALSLSFNPTFLFIIKDTRSDIEDPVFFRFSQVVQQVLDHY